MPAVSFYFATLSPIAPLNVVTLKIIQNILLITSSEDNSEKVLLVSTELNPLSIASPASVGINVKSVFVLS